MYFGSLTTPLLSYYRLFFSCHHIHLLIDSIISVEITDEIWKLHHTRRCKKKRKKCHNSKEDPGIIFALAIKWDSAPPAFALSKLLPLENDGSPSHHHPTMSHGCSKSQHIH